MDLPVSTPPTKKPRKSTSSKDPSGTPKPPTKLGRPRKSDLAAASSSTTSGPSLAVPGSGSAASASSLPSTPFTPKGIQKPKTTKPKRQSSVLSAQEEQDNKSEPPDDLQPPPASSHLDSQPPAASTSGLALPNADGSTPQPLAPGASQEDEKKDDVIDDEEDYEDILVLPSVAKNADAMKSLLDSFALNPEELDRYEVYRRSVINKSTCRKFIQNIIGHPPQQSVLTIVQGAGKLFVGELVELAKDVMEEWGEEGAITPAQLREAFRRYRQQGDRMKAVGYQEKLLL
ncbi:hTAFII28-like protein conserved region-domain-containing protein [Polychytrium aggregatum]|uniref:hTAFII28-like protein conserved region-domain-containing protein n=1 Tax=Polychytrium aggregatum TaxID=110093 RepID=UPI0022FDE6C9|nr:hTAFII28-like protein conserved region-domain-containing protein [Polychytrium aggregatum]KAI9204226.1 hTAFII28-like protein conserved region-domain-containing protein [Polychytrium aggregatum]